MSFEVTNALIHESDAYQARAQELLEQAGQITAKAGRVPSQATRETELALSMRKLLVDAGVAYLQDAQSKMREAVGKVGEEVQNLPPLAVEIVMDVA